MCIRIYNAKSYAMDLYNVVLCICVYVEMYAHADICIYRLDYIYFKACFFNLYEYLARAYKK